MTTKQKAALTKFREELNEKLAGIRSDAELIHVGDDLEGTCAPSVAWGAREIALAFNDVASLLGLEPIEVPEELEQEDEDDEI